MTIIDDNILIELKADIRKSQVQAGVEVNKVMLQLYWRIGRTISEFESDGFSSMDVISRLSNELANIYSTAISFSKDNLGYMQKFYAAYPDVAIVQELLAQIPWDYHIVLLHLVETYEERIYYASMVIEHGWGPDRLKEVILTNKN